MSRATLRVRTGPLAGQEIALKHGRTRIGRDEACELCPSGYHKLSRVHACLIWDGNGFTIEDLGSSNGMFVEGQRTTRCRLAPGQTFQVGDFVAQLSLPSARPQAVDAPRRQGPAARDLGEFGGVRLTQMFPILARNRSRSERFYLVPGIVTVVFVAAAYQALKGGDFDRYFQYFAGYIECMSLFFIYYLCRHPKPWWMLAGTAVLTYLMLISPIWEIFGHIFPMGATGESLNEPFPNGFINAFCGPGMREELFKAVPIFAALYLARRLSSPLKEQVGVWNPMDGILLGAASSIGFTLNETLTQYVPDEIHRITVASNDPGLGLAAGIALLIPRVVSSVMGHMAYSGYFGYFIGLSVIRPKVRWQLIGVGYLTAALLHGLWDSMANSVLFQLIIGAASYACLIAAIFKAREIFGIRNTNYTSGGS